MSAADREFENIVRQFRDEQRADTYAAARRAVDRHVAMITHSTDADPEAAIKAWDYLVGRITNAILTAGESEYEDRVEFHARMFAAALFMNAELRGQQP